ncbi:MAG: type II toxin-antitoxin system PemK/MazF family toxin [Candidatus Parvarchaeota archaeon]|nr:type II toxin-antitoxin system PemK/MazF family toxin [Candidatus Parvarchaeota archaeon]
MNEGEIYFVRLPENEREGSEIRKDRYAIIIKNFVGHAMVFVVAVSKGEKRFDEPLNVPIVRTVENGLATDSVAVTYQAFSISKGRLVNKIGNLDAESFALVKENLRRGLGL